MTDNGHYRCYTRKTFSADHLKIIKSVNDIIAAYEARGMVLTLRQIFYQFVSRIDPKANTEAFYKRLGDIVSQGRIAGLISWTAIEDRNRSLRGVTTYDKPSDILRAAKESYKRDLWADQEWRPEVWIEKAALEGVISTICNRLRVDFFACRGYNSQSEQWRAGQRFADYIRRGQRPIVFHLGDHDPSGLDMTRDNRERLALFAGVPILVQRLALNMNQIEEFRPPPNPAKMTDSRATDYVASWGDKSWELDALDPALIQGLIESAVLQVRDEAKWDAALLREVEEQRLLEEAVELFGGERG